MRACSPGPPRIPRAVALLGLAGAALVGALQPDLAVLSCAGAARANRRRATAQTAGGAIAISLVILRTVALLWTARHGDDRRHLVGKVYVRGPHNRLLELDFTPQSTVWWATQRALIALNDPRDPNQCRLVLHSNALRPRRSLAKSGVCDGDTLELVAAKTVPRRSRLPTRLHQAIARLGIRTRPRAKSRDARNPRLPGS